RPYPASSTMLVSSAPSLFTHTTTTQIYPLSLHDALPISSAPAEWHRGSTSLVEAFPAFDSADSGIHGVIDRSHRALAGTDGTLRSEEHTSELQSRGHLVCRLLLEKKNLSGNAFSVGWVKS